MQRSEKKRTAWAERFCIAVVWIIMVVILTGLAAISMWVTCSVYGGNEVIQYGVDQPLLHLALIVIIIGVGAFLISRGIHPFLFLKDIVRYLNLILIVAIIFFLWVGITMFGVTSDQRMAIESAQALISGDFSPWASVGFRYGTDLGITGYAFTYPSQNGLILFFSLLTFLFREGTPFAVQFLNVGFLFAGLFSLGQLFKDIFSEESMEGIELLLALFLPFTFYITFVYGTIPGFACAAAALYYEHSFLKGGGIKSFAAASFCISGAVLLKSNYMIILAAMVIYLITGGIFRKKIEFALAAVLMIFFYLGSAGMMNNCLEKLTGTPISQGSPMLAWVEMGLQDGNRAPGWYNGYNIAVFRENDLDTEKTKAAVQEDLKKTLTEFAEDPKMTREFFLKKTASLWAEPTFQSLWIQEIKGDSWLVPKLTKSLFNENKVLNRIYIAFFNFIQSLVYAGVLLYLLLCRKNITWLQLLPAVIFIGGFLFHLLWEAKGQYSVCYFILLIPYALMGVKVAVEKTGRMLR